MRNKDFGFNGNSTGVKQELVIGKNSEVKKLTSQQKAFNRNTQQVDDLTKQINRC